MESKFPGTIALANGQEVNAFRAVNETRETRGAPVNPLTPVISPAPATPSPQPTTQPAPKPAR